MAHDVFISYSSADKAVADAMCATLEQRRIRCWIAPRDVLPGKPYAESLTEALTSSRAMVVVVSNHANGSVHVMREVETAVSSGIAVVPFRIEDVELSASLSYFLKAIHWLDAITPPVEQHLQRLATTLEGLLGAEAGRGETISPGPASDLWMRTPIPPTKPRPARTVRTAMIVAASVLGVGLIGWGGWRMIVPGSTPAASENALQPAKGAHPAAEPEPPPAAPSDKDRLQGRWRLVSNDRNGKRESIAEDERFELEFRGDELFQHEPPHKPTGGRYVLRTDVEPHVLDQVFQFEGGDGKTRTNRISALYRFIGDDRLELAIPSNDSFNSPDPKTPRSFDTSSEPVDVNTYERVR